MSIMCDIIIRGEPGWSRRSAGPTCTRWRRCS